MNNLENMHQINQSTKRQKMQKTVALYTMGCRLNFSESGQIGQGFTDRGYLIVPFEESQNIDIVFINTCTVTDGADSTCRNIIRKAQRNSPEAKIIVAGCYAQMEADKIHKMTGVDLILGTSEKYNVFKYLDLEMQNSIHIDHSLDFYSAATSKVDGHTRAFLKIQDGCNYICSYCIIPQARGRSRAISIKEAVSKAKSLIKEGFKEIVLTGVNIGEYEMSSGEKLLDLTKALLEIDGLERFRLSSVEPNTFNDDLLLLLKDSPKFMPHFHIPMQSGNDYILKNMRRKYNHKFYADLLLKINKLFPNSGIGADIIAGFPGETRKMFNDTKEFASLLPITHFHVFPYSKRKGTIASAMEGHIQYHEKKERVRELITLGDLKLEEFAKAQIGATTKVLLETQDFDGNWTGYTENFIKTKVYIKEDSIVARDNSRYNNHIVTVKIKKYENCILHADFASIT